MAPRPEDQRLASAQFAELNRRFYGGNPAAYFRSRLHLLLLAAGRSEELDRLMVEGVQYGKLRAHIQPAIDAQDDEHELLAYVVTDAEVLLHHSCEALFRLLFAHAGRPPCPWLEAARLRSFAEFKRRLAQFTELPTSTENVENVARVFLGRGLEAGNDELAKAAAEISRQLAVLAGHLLSEGNLYNSAKHGLAVVAGTVAFGLDAKDGSLLIEGEGPAVDYLEVKSDHWHTTTRFVNITKVLLLINLAVRYIDTIWTVARHHYLREPATAVQYMTKEGFDLLLKTTVKDAHPLETVSMRLAYYKIS